MANHYKFYDKIIYDLADKCDKIQYIFCSEPKDLNNYNVNFQIINDSLKIDGIEFYNIDSETKNVGHFILRVDGLTFYYQTEFKNRDLEKYKSGIKKK